MKLNTPMLGLTNVFDNISWFKGYGIYAEHVDLSKSPKMYNVLGKRAEEILGRNCHR